MVKMACELRVGDRFGYVLDLFGPCVGALCEVVCITSDSITVRHSFGSLYKFDRDFELVVVFKKEVLNG